jgi:hypothetical protein
MLRFSTFAQAANPRKKGASGWYPDAREQECRALRAGTPVWAKLPLSYPLSNDVRSLSRMIDYGHATVAECCMGVYENTLGGRICVAGYYPWSFLLGYAKSIQIKRIIRWLLKDTLPGFIGSYQKINLWAQRTAEGQPAFILANSSLMEAEGLELYIRTRGTRLMFTGMDNKPVEIRSEGTDGGYTIFSLLQINAMSIAIAFLKSE